MAYCTQADILDQLDEARLIQLTDDDGLGTIIPERVTTAIADADAEIDGYVGSRHAVPLSPVPTSIRMLSVQIAIHNLYARREIVMESRENQYKAAVRYLEKVAAGQLSLGIGNPDGNPPASEAPEMSGDNPDRAFTRNSMRGF